MHLRSVDSQLRVHAGSGSVPGTCVAARLPFDRPPSLHHLRRRLCVGIVRGFTGTTQPSNSSHLPRRLRLYDFPARPGAANAATGDVRSPKFRRFPFIRNGVSDHGRAVTPRIAVHNILPSTSSNVSASARLNFSRLNIPLRMIAVYASQPPSPATTQHSLEGGSLLPYPRRTCTGWKAPASLGARRGREPGLPGPPAEIRRAAFPHRAPVEGRTRPKFGA